MDSRVFQLVKTQVDVTALINEIDILVDSLYRTGEDSYAKVLHTKIGVESAKLFSEAHDDKETRKQSLLQLKSDLTNLVPLRLTLAFYPTPESVDKIVTWARTNIDKAVIMDYVVDSTILGGAIIEYQGKYADLSLRKKLDESFFVPPPSSPS